MHWGMARRTNDGNLKITDRVLDILASLNCAKNCVSIGLTLERHDYLALNEILEALGGKWNRKAKAHLFAEGVDAAELLEAAMLTGSVRDPRVGDFFETPRNLARDIVERAGIKRGDSVLEPSAGLGRIAGAAAEAAGGPKQVCVVELEEARRVKLVEAGYILLLPHNDFLKIPPHHHFDAVVMNPPFSKEQDIAHVRHAYDFVRPGGRLVAVMGAGMRFRSTKNAVAFRAWLDEIGAEVEDLPEGTFKSEGTLVRACLVTIEK